MSQGSRSAFPPPWQPSSLDLEDPEARRLLHLWIRAFALTAAPLRELEAYVIYSVQFGLNPGWAVAYPLDLDCVGTPVCLTHRQAWFTFCQRVRTAIHGLAPRRANPCTKEEVRP